MTQRCVLLLVMILFLCFGTVFLYGERVNRALDDWETIQTERFLKRLCLNGNCSFEEVVSYIDSLNQRENRWNISIEEYKREQDLENKGYYSLVSWEEIKEILQMNGCYCFSEESMILIEVIQIGRATQKKNRYCGWVTEELK